MATPLSHEEAMDAIARVLHGVIHDREIDAWLALVERSLGLPEGAVSALVYHPEAAGLPPEPTAEQVLAAAFARAGRDENDPRVPPAY